MKHKLTALFTSLLLVVATLLAAFGFASCNKYVDPVAITVDEPVAEGTTLLDIMTQMQTDGELTFTVANGMLTELNGTKNGTNSYWMLYTSDTDPENARADWGTLEYDGQTLGSAAKGVAELPVKQGEIYVWAYQTF